MAGMSKFDQLAGKLAKKPGVYDPKALAAAIGRRKYGVSGMAKKAIAGRRKAEETKEGSADSKSEDAAEKRPAHMHEKVRLSKMARGRK